MNRQIRFLIAILLSLGLGWTVDLRQETIEQKVEWTVPVSIGNSPRNFDNVSSYLATFNGYTYLVFTDKNFTPRVAKIKDGDATIKKLDGDYKTLNDGHNTFSLGIDRDGYIHISGDMHHHPFDNNDHLDEPYKSAPCLYWKSDEPENISSFTFLGKDEEKVIPGVGHTYQYFFNDKNGKLYVTSRQWVRNDGHWTYNSGKIALGLAVYNKDIEKWMPFGDVAPLGEGAHPRAVEDKWKPNENKVLFWDPAGVDSTPYQTWHNDFNFDENNRLHMATGMNTDWSGNGSHPGSGTAICYAYSDDGGQSWNKADGSAIESLPLRYETTDVIASGHWYVMEAGLAVVDGHPLVTFRKFKENGINSQWRQYSSAGWKDVVTLPVSYRRAKPRVDTKGVITIVEYDDVYRANAYDQEGVEHEMPYDMFDMDQPYFEKTGNFRFTSKVRSEGKDVLGIVRLEITPEDGPPTMISLPKSNRNLSQLPKVFLDAAGRLHQTSKSKTPERIIFSH